MAAKLQLQNENEEFIQTEACRHFIKKYYNQSQEYAFDKKYTIFDVQMQVKNYFKACTELGVSAKFANIKEISIGSLEKAFAELEYTCDRRKIFFRFVYTGPLVYNNCTEQHQMPVGRNQWANLLQQCQEC